MWFMDLTDDEAPRIFGDHDSFIVVDDKTWMMDWKFVPSIFVVAHNYGIFLRDVFKECVVAEAHDKLLIFFIFISHIYQLL